MAGARPAEALLQLSLLALLGAPWLEIAPNPCLLAATEGSFLVGPSLVRYLNVVEAQSVMEGAQGLSLDAIFLQETWNFGALEGDLNGFGGNSSARRCPRR